MSQEQAGILTINAGSSSIKFSAYTREATPRRILGGVVERIGTSESRLVGKDQEGKSFEEAFDAPDHPAAARKLIAWLGDRRFAGIGHRVVHGGLKLIAHQAVTADVLKELKAAQELDLAHLPREIALIEAFAAAMPQSAQFACFDSAFHHDMPDVAKLLPIPRRFLDTGVRRLGFHGLSYAYLMDELRRTIGDAAAGRIVLMHLGSGASLAAVRSGKVVDTTMAFTPTAGIVMATRPGDLDPGLLVYMARSQKLSFDQMDDLINRDCGMAGMAGGVADMRDLLTLQSADRRAAEAIELFCYQAKKAIGALVAVLGGVDIVVFSGGIGEHVPEIRARICKGLELFGIELDAGRNERSAEIISTASGRVDVRVIRTDEEIMIAMIVLGLM